MNPNVLVVDDSPTIVKFLSFSLRAAGYSVIAARDGMDAIERVARGGAVDLIITDLNMPNMDGYELIATLRENPDFDSVPIIILSSEESASDQARGREVGANAYLVKPFKAEELLLEVKRLLGRSKSQIV